MNQSQIDRLSRLAELQASGTLNDDEFETHKAKVLRGSRPGPVYVGGGALVLASAAALGVWSFSGDQTIPDRSAAIGQQQSTAQQRQRQAAEATRALQERRAVMLTASDELVSAITSYADEAKRSAESHVEAVNQRMFADQQSIAGSSSLYANSGGAGVAARLNREESMRARAVLGLTKAKSVLETGLPVNRSVASYLNAKRTYLASDGKEPSLSKIVGFAYASFASLRPLQRAVQSIGGAADFEAVDQRFNRLSNLLTAYNINVAESGVESIVVKRPVASRPISQTADVAAQPEVHASTSPVFTKTERRKMDIYDSLNDQCRGGGQATEAESEAVCAKRDAYSDVVFRAGLCLGRGEQATFEFQWHRCDNQSYATQYRASNPRSE